VKSSSILIMALAAGALGAQGAPKLDGRVQLFEELYRPAQVVVAQPGAPNPDVEDQPTHQNGLGIRFMGEVAAHPGWYYELGGMFNGSSNFTYNGNVTSAVNLNLTQVKVTDSYWSLGAAYMAILRDRLTLGAHLEARGEYLRINGPYSSNGSTAQVYQSTTYLRPWLRGSADYTFTGIGNAIHPFIGVDGSYALTHTSQLSTPDFASVDGRNLKALAPRASASLYAGMRF
jgi:hypothetical protein